MRTITLSIFLLISQLTFGQGINFLEIGFDKTLQEAKKQNKILFLEVYLDGCHHCEALAPILTKQKQVGDFYNPSFVSMKVEANSKESAYIQNTRKIGYTEFPLFFYFDTTGKLIHQAAPQTEVNPTQPFTLQQLIDEAIRHGKSALTPNERTSNYPARFDTGDRDLTFLVNYARMAKTTRDLPAMKKINDVFGEIFIQPADLESPSGLFIISRFIDDYQNPMAQYFFKNLEKYKTLHNPKDVNDAAMGIVHSTTYGLRTNTISADEMIQLRKELLRCGLPAINAANGTLIAELNAHFREKNYAKAVARINEQIKSFKIGFQDYDYFCRFFNENTPDNSTAASVVQWSKNALLLLTKPQDKAKPEVADLYLQQTTAYEKLNNKVEAKKSAALALKTTQATLLLYAKPEDKTKPEVAYIYYLQSMAYMKLENKTEANKAANLALQTAQMAKIADLSAYNKQVEATK